MNLQTRNVADVVVVVVPGPAVLDVSVAPAFKEAMAAILGRSDKIVLDLSAVTFIDSSGVGAILFCMRRLASRGGDLKVCCLQASVRTVLELVRLHRVLDICNDQSEAVRRFT